MNREGLLPLSAMIAALAVVSAYAAAPTAKRPIKLMIPSQDTCSAFVEALNGGDTATMLDLGGWALGFLSGVAQASGKDILGNTTSQVVMDQIAEACKNDQNKPISSIVESLSQSLMASTP
jgi:HdeA/HdeB family